MRLTDKKCGECKKKFKIGDYVTGNGTGKLFHTRCIK